MMILMTSFAWTLVSLWIALAPPALAESTKTPTTWIQGTQIERIDGSAISFKGPHPPLETKLFSIEAHGILFESKEQTHPPYLLLTALPCSNCDKKKSLYLIRADGEEVTSFVYPGTIRDPKTGTPVHEGRAFYGDCSSRYPRGLIIFQKDRIDRRRFMQQSVIIVQAGEHGRLDEKVLTSRMPTISDVIRKTQGKNPSCKEIQGFSRNMTRAKPMDHLERETNWPL